MEFLGTIKESLERGGGRCRRWGNEWSPENAISS